MKRVLFIAIGSMMTAHASGQSIAVPKIVKTGPTIYSFIPKGYDTLEGGISYGDLNNDGLKDAAIVLGSELEKGGADDDNPPKRILLVLINKVNGYMLAGTSSDIIMCKGCGGMLGDPFSNMDIRKGILTISHYGGSAWRWLDDEKFQYRNGGVYLIGSTKDYFWNVSDCNGKGVGDAGRKYKDTNWVTGDQEVIENNEDCKPIKRIKHKIKKKPLVKLEAFKHDL